MLFRFIGLFTLLALLPSCAPTTIMQGPQGQAATCQAVGDRIISTIIAHVAHDDCVAQYRALGYRAAGEPAPTKSE